MWHLLLPLIVFSIVAFGAGCAETGACPAGEVRMDGDCVSLSSKIIPVGCRNSFPGGTSLLDWELTVSPTRIESGEPFAATLDGVAVFNEFFVDAAQTVYPGGFQEVNLFDLNATVHVRSGATGDDVSLTLPESIPYECVLSRTECDPSNDLPGVLGDRGNTDCEPEADSNPCGRSVLVPTSTDCAPGGVCADLGKTGPGSPCSDNGFCVTGDLRIELGKASSDYTADSEGEVLFGWADERSGATIDEMPVFEDPTGPIGIRFGIGTFLVAFECTMRAEDSALISFPIEITAR